MKYLRTIIILYTFLIIPCIAKSEVIKTWVCTEPNGADDIIIAQINEGKKSGQIKIAKITYDTIVYSGTLFSRWEFGSNESGTSYNYALVIKSNGEGLYFDFTKGYTIEPSQRLRCKSI